MQEIINAYGLTASESLMLILQEQEAPDASRETCEVCDLNGEGDRKNSPAEAMQKDNLSGFITNVAWKQAPLHSIEYFGN